MSYSARRRSQNNATPVLTDMEKRYEAETGSTMFSKPKKKGNIRHGGGQSKKERDAYEDWSKTTAGMNAGRDRFNAMMANRSQNPVLGQTQSGMSGFDRFQAMQAARDSGTPQPTQKGGGLSGNFGVAPMTFGDSKTGYDKFQAIMGANPLILQQLQMGQRQMGPQFNAFGFGAQPGLAAQGGQGGSMLANMSSQGLNQLAAGQQNNPTIFKAKS
ncbi:hypothetical protein N9074_01375 [Akkermansiaceae bacterium]|nr:hypothetical protein [Akkermansiaceae bacterium]